MINIEEKYLTERILKNSQSHIGTTGEKNGKFGKRKYKKYIDNILLLRDAGNTFQ